MNQKITMAELQHLMDVATELNNVINNSKSTKTELIDEITSIWEQLGDWIAINEWDKNN